MGLWSNISTREQDLHNLRCSFVKKPIVYIHSLTQAKIEALMESYPYQEWCGYLQGIEDLVLDIYIPPHEQASGVQCIAEPFHIPKDCIGFLHSHHSMGASHSGQDARTVDINYKLSIVVARRYGQTIEYNALATVKTLCNHEALVQAEVRLLRTERIHTLRRWLEGAKHNIDKSKMQASVIQIPVPMRKTTTLVKPVTIDREGNLHDRNGLFAGRNKRTVNPVDRQVYYLDGQGQLFTQQDIDNIKEGKSY